MKRIEGYYWARDKDGWQIVQYFEYPEHEYSWYVFGSEIPIENSEIDNYFYEILPEPIPEPCST